MDDRTLAERIADAILLDVRGRKGWDSAWDTFDEDIREHIRDGWIDTIQRLIEED